MSKLQNVETKVKGLRCEIQIMNHSGHDVLTTYDPEVENSCEVATADLEAFWGDCVDEFRSKGKETMTPNVYGRTEDMPDGVTDLIDIHAPDFDLEQYTQILIQPVPLTGG